MKFKKFISIILSCVMFFSVTLYESYAEDGAIFSGSDQNTMNFTAEENESALDFSAVDDISDSENAGEEQAFDTSVIDAEDADEESRDSDMAVTDVEDTEDDTEDDTENTFDDVDETDNLENDELTSSAESKTTEDAPLLVGNVYKIYTASELIWVSSQVSENNTFAGYVIELNNDLDLKESEWKSIGYNMNNYFAGIFDGNNHTLTNLKSSISIDSGSIKDAPKHTTGLFGVCIGATVKNLVIENSDFSISNESGYSHSYSSINGTNIYGGMVCGYAENCSFSHIIVRNSNVKVYTGAESANAYAGGIAGYAKESDFVHCGNEKCKVSGTSDSLNNDAHAGGIIGELENSGVVRQCYNLADIFGGASISGAYTGGIIGKSSNTSNTLSSIRDCYNQGKITHSGSWMETAYAGGIIGYSSSAINRCYNSGVVYANTNTINSAQLAGIAGSGISSSSVSNSAVMCSQISGGTSHYTICGAGEKENNIAYSGLNATNDAIAKYGINEFYGSSLYSGKLMWDFSSIWISNENGYPELKYIDSDIATDIEIVEEAAKEVRIDFANGDTYDRVTQDIQLIDATNGAVVSWESSNENVLSSSGIVTRQSEDYLVKISAIISVGTYSVTKIFSLNVLGAGSPQETEKADWGLRTDQARVFVAYMRGCSLKNVSNDDPDVLVLTGQDTNEDHVADTLVKVMKYWEVPNESAYLKSQIGDVIGLLKQGEKDVISGIIGGPIGNFLDDVTGVNGIDSKIVSKVFSQVFGKAYDAIAAYDIGYEEAKNGKNYTFQEKGSLWKALSWGDIASESMSYIIQLNDEKPPASTAMGSKIGGYLKKAITSVKLISAWNDEMQNSTKAYLRLYSQNRGMFDSPDDENFKLIMDAIDVTNFIGNEVDLNELGETLFLLNQKFGGNYSDDYKITIKCPVDVIVYDESGKIVGRVINNKVDETVNNSLLITVGGVNNDEKTVYFQDTENYTLSLIGNDTGAMNVDIETWKSGVKSTYSYNNIPLSDDKRMSMAVSSLNVSEGGELPVIKVIKDGVETDEIKSVDSNTIQYHLDINSCIEDSTGKIKLSTIGGFCASCDVTPGTLLVPLITVNDGYLLEGLYTDSNCTNVYSDDKMPDHELTLYAKFKIDKSKISVTILSQPKDHTYFTGDKSEALEVAIDGVADYKLQWYCFTDTKDNAIPITGADSLIYTPSTENEGITFYFLRIAYYSGDKLIYLDSNNAKITVQKNSDDKSDNNPGENGVKEDEVKGDGAKEDSGKDTSDDNGSSGQYSYKEPTIQISAKKLILKVKQKTKVLYASGLANGDKVIGWKSSNTKIVRVTMGKNGHCTVTAGKKTGKAKLTVTLKSGLTKTVPVTVQKKAVKTTKITGIPKKISLKKKESKILSPILTPITSSDKITFSSNNTKVVSVTKKGKVTGKKKGTAVITVKSGNKAVKCKITVK